MVGTLIAGSIAHLPLAMADVDLACGASAPTVAPDARGAWVLLRWRGRPVGHAVVGAERGIIDADEWHRALVSCAPSLRHARLVEALERARTVATPDTLPSVTIAVCTRDRPADLRRALTSLVAQDYRGTLEIVVVDNAPTSNATAQVCHAFAPRVRYVLEPRPGLDWARNRAVQESQGELIVFTDDDCVADERWVAALVAPLTHDPLVGCVTGLVVPLELATEAQWQFEAYGGFNRGYRRRWFRMDPSSGRPIARRWGGTGQFGTGANMAFRRSVLAALGGFDPALDVGTATQGAGDLEMYFRVLKAGFALVYEPAALIRHGHRRSSDALHRQLATWGSGMGAYLIKSWRDYPTEHRGFAWVGLWLAQHWATRLARTLLQLDPFPPSLVAGEVAMAVASPWCLHRAQREAHRITQAFGPLEVRDGVADPRTALAHASRCAECDTTPVTNGVAVVDVEDGVPFPLRALDGGPVRLFARVRGQPVGHVDLPAASGPWQPLQLADALAEAVLPLGDTVLYLMADGTADLHSASLKCHGALSADVPVSICIATRDRPDDLRRCLTRLTQLEFGRPVEIVVVDNNPASGVTPAVVAHFPAVRLVEEARPGLSYARNAGFAACRGDIVAVTDDDVIVGEDWLECLLAPFSRREVQLVTGNVLPAELRAESQWRFEEYGGLGRGYWPWSVDHRWLKQSRRYAARTWALGAAANHAVRAAWLRHPAVGPLDPHLGAGSPSGVGEDTALFYDTLSAGGTIAYEPAAVVWHRHRTSLNELSRQLHDYSSGHVGYHSRILRRHGDIRGIWHLAFDVPRHLVRRLWDRVLGRHDYPWRLLRAEVQGFLRGPFDVLRAVRYVRQHGRATPFGPPDAWNGAGRDTVGTRVGDDA